MANDGFTVQEILDQLKAKQDEAGTSPEEQFGLKLASHEENLDQDLHNEDDDDPIDTTDDPVLEADAEKIAKVQEYDQLGRIAARAMMDEFSKVAFLDNEQAIDYDDDDEPELTKEAAEARTRILTNLYNNLNQ